jgi:hypothetical protein
VKRAAVIVCLAACNQVFDLKETESIDAGVGADIDGDGVGDTVDNCQLVKNSDQANADGDAFGDACDSCPRLATTSTHDEDRDRTGDDCDLCPGTPDFNVDEDADGVGDLCDPVIDKTGVANHRVVFDPFVTLRADWHPDLVPWSQANDTIGPDMELGPGDRLRNTAITTPTTWTATVGLESHSHWENDSYSLRAENSTDVIECSVKCTRGGTTTSCVGSALRNGVSQIAMPVPVVPQPRIFLSITVKQVGAPYCQFGNGYAYSAGVTPAENMKLSITASLRIRPAYFEYIE